MMCSRSDYRAWRTPSKLHQSSVPHSHHVAATLWGGTLLTSCLLAALGAPAAAVYSGSDAWPFRMVQLPGDDVAARIAQRSVLLKVGGVLGQCAGSLRHGLAVRIEGRRTVVRHNTTPLACVLCAHSALRIARCLSALARHVAWLLEAQVQDHLGGASAGCRGMQAAVRTC